MFRRVFEPQDMVRFSFNATDVTCARGDSIAAAFLASGIDTVRATPVSGAPRGPFCLMGVCFDCLVEIDGEVVQACMVEARDGMIVMSPKLPEDIA